MVLFVPQKYFRTLMKADFRLAENYIAYLSERLHFLNRKIEGLAGPGPEWKLAMFLSEHGREREDGVFALELKPSMTELSSMLGVARASLYRAFGILTREGLIRRKGKKIEIIDMERLRNLCS